MAKCELCDATPPDTEIGDHLLREHPEVGDFECWRDAPVPEDVEGLADLLEELGLRDQSRVWDLLITQIGPELAVLRWQAAVDYLHAKAR